MICKTIGHTIYNSCLSTCWACLSYSLSFHGSSSLSYFKNTLCELHTWDLVYLLLHTSKNIPQGGSSVCP